MFSSLKKWVKNEENPQVKQPPAGLQTMRSDLQRKFAKGVQYNLKIVIRGDRNSGKTCLWHRLQGHKFVEEYVPTPEIQATSIHWNYKATDDIVKVDVWDVVDKGKPKQSSKTLKLTHDKDSDDECRLDANFLDVYKGAHAVLLVFDITKRWTYQYVEKELPKIPAHIPVLVLANHRDMGTHRIITLDELQALVESIERPTGSADIFYLESSMKSGFGLKYIHKFFNLPFLLVQRESLLKLLETNHLDVESCMEELRYEPSSEEQNYDYFLRALGEKQNQVKKGKQPTDSVSPSVNGRESTAPAATVSQSPHSSTTRSQAEPASRQHAKPPTSLNVQSEPEQKPGSGGLFSPSMMTGASPTEESRKEPEKKGFMSRFFRGSSATKQEANKNSEGDAPVIVPKAPACGHGPVDIDKFVPDDEGTDNFLNEIPDTASSKRFNDDDNESSSDEDAGNPMVAGFQEELDSDDQIGTETHKVYSYSDSDDDYKASAPKQPAVPTSVSTRSAPKSRLSPEPHVEDVKLQHLDIESDSSKENSPYVLPDEDTISGVETSIKPNTYNYSSSDDAVGSLTHKCEDTFNSRSKTALTKDAPHAQTDVKNKRASFDATDELSSDGETGNAMVSTVVDDLDSDEDIPESPKTLKKEPSKKLELQLGTSDFDFLEQISTSAPDQDSLNQKSSKSAKHRSKSKKKQHDDEDVSKKHKHKKKKSKSSKEEIGVESKSSKKKSLKKKTVEDKALEEFLAGGDDSY